MMVNFQEKAYDGTGRAEMEVKGSVLNLDKGIN